MMDASPAVSLRVVSFTPSPPSSQPVIVFVAGWISMMRGWKKVLREMTKDFQVHYVETREKISSSVRGSAGFSVEEIGSDLVPLIQRLELKNYILFGSSLGATAIVDCYPLLDPKPMGLILVTPNAAFRVPQSWKILVTIFYAPLYALIRPAVKWYLKTFRLNVARDRAQYEKYKEALDIADPRKLKRAVMAVWSYEIWNKLPLVDCPVLVVNASHDKLHEPENLRRIVAGLPNASQVDLGTNAQTHDRPVVEAMRTFLRNMRKRAPRKSTRRRSRR